MRRRSAFCAGLLFLGALAPAAEEGLSRTSWGRFGWWEVSVGAHNRTHIDGLLAYSVTLEGLNGIIRTQPGEQWAGAAPYMTEPLARHCRLWEIKISGVGAGRSRLGLARTWRFRTDPEDLGLAQGWEQPGLADASWRPLIVGSLAAGREEAVGPFEKEKGAGWGAQLARDSGGRSGAWENQGLPDYDGVAWYRLRAVIPAAWRDEPVFFHCFGIDDEDTTFVNGVRIGATTMAENPNAYRAERIYEIPTAAIRWGEPNCFAVRVFDDHGQGGFTGSAPELVRGRAALTAQSVTPAVPGEAPGYIKDFNWVTKRIELPDYSMTYSLASALVRVSPKGDSVTLRWDTPIRHAAYVTGTGLAVVSPGDGIFHDPARDGPLQENWMLVWHGAGVGQNADRPVLIVLHQRPQRIHGDGNELTLTGALQSFEIGPPFGLRQFNGKDTAAWAATGLPDDVGRACRFWSRAALAYPVGHKEFYAVDHDREMVTITQKYTYDTVRDAWNTEPLQVAPLPPVAVLLLDAGYPGRILTPRRDPGFVSYAGPFAATVGADTAAFEVPIPVEDSFAGLNTPGQEAQLDELTRGIMNLMQRWSGWDWKMMGSDSGPLEHLAPGAEEPMDFDRARERALAGDYPVIGIPQGHVPGAPMPTSFTSSPLNHSVYVPPFLIADARVRPGILAGMRRMAQAMDRVWSDDVFHSGIWRVEFEPTFRKPMTYLAMYRYENVSDRANGEAPYDFTAIAGHIAYGFREAALWTGRWDMVRKRWHKLLQVCDPFWRNHDWATGACDNKDARPNSSVDITWDHTAGLEALARCAYGVGDSKTYDFLCYLRARVALASVCHEALQQYLQPVLHWPDHYFAGHVGEPYPPYNSGLLPEGGVAMEWSPPYPAGALNQIPWRFNNAGVSCPAVGLRWMAMTQPEQTRWALRRLATHTPHYLDGDRCAAYSGDEAPPMFPSVQRDTAANCLTLRTFLGDSIESVLTDFGRLSRAPVPIPFYVERMTLLHGRGQLQNLLYTRSCPLWASAWEPRVLRQGRYDPASGTATLGFEPGSRSLRFKGGTYVKPQAVLLNGQRLPERAGLGAARADGGWYYAAGRATLHVHSTVHDRIEMQVRFAPDPNPPAPVPRLRSEPPLLGFDTNLLGNASFDETVQDLARSPFVGAFTGPFLYVNRWMVPGSGADYVTPFQAGLVAQVGVPCRTAGLALRLFPGKATRVVQNVPAAPGLHRLSLWLQLGRRRWDPALTRGLVILEALQAESGAIRVLADASLVLAPEQLQRDVWTPVVLELDAPEETDAIRVGIALESPSAGDGEPRNPVYVDDVRVIRARGPSPAVTQPLPAAAAAPGPDANLIVHWPLDRIGPDQAVTDASGNRNHGRLAGPLRSVPGRIGKALLFDGVDNDITSPDFRGMDMVRGNFTVATWFRTDWRDAGGKTIMSCGQDASRYAGVIFQYRVLESGHGRFETYLARTGEAGYILSRGHEPRVNDGVWHHLALSVDRSGAAVTYVDGDQVHSVDIAPWQAEPLATRGGVYFGRGRYAKPDFEFALDDFRVYGRALTGDEILQIIDAGPPLPDPD